MSWQILISLSILLYSLSTLLQRIVLKEEESDPIAYSIFFQLLVAVFILPVIVFAQEPILPKNFLSLIFNLILMTFLYGIASILIFQALKKMEASRFTIIFSSRGIFTVIASSVLIQESLTPTQLLGALFIMFGIITAHLKSLHFKFTRTDLKALAAGVCVGIAMTNDRILLRSFNIFPYVFLAFVFPALFVISLYPEKIKKLKIFFEKRLFSKLALLSLIYTVTAITFGAALKLSSNSAQIAAINLSSVIITVILAIILLKEREHLINKILGSLLCFIGLLLLT